jgi:hypothetical protein
MKVIVAGSRDYNNRDKVYKVLSKLHKHKKDIEIVSGLAKGPDTFGKEWAEVNGVRVHKFPAQWNTHGKRAGPIRNEEMARFADALIAFWDGKSRGTGHMITIAHEYNLKVMVVRE